MIEEGAKGSITGERKDLLEQVAKSFPSEQIAICPGDLCQPNDNPRIIDQALSFGEEIQILVNNAGTDRSPADVTVLDPATWTREYLLTGQVSFY